MMRGEKSSGMQIERTAKVIQDALMEAAASVRNRKDGLSRGGTDHSSPVRLACKHSIASAALCLPRAIFESRMPLCV